MCGAQQIARGSVVAKAAGSGAVGSWDKLQQDDYLGAPPLARWHDSSSRAGGLLWRWWCHPLAGYWMMSEGGAASSGDWVDGFSQSVCRFMQ